MLNFHKNPDVTIVNNVIRNDERMFTQPSEVDVEIARDKLVENDYAHMHKKEYERLKEIIANENVRSVKFSNPMILAWVYTVVQNYPDMIPYIENALYVERRINI